jgi:endogenous inhibitor of DNA gyrase (YacG/DUF329 family)
MPDDLPKPIEFPCPTCGAIVSVQPDDQTAVRRIGSDKGRPFVTTPLLIQVECKACGRRIVQTMMD